MLRTIKSIKAKISSFINGLGLSVRTKLVVVFLFVEVLPLVLLTFIAWRQYVALGTMLQDNVLEDSTAALNASAVENIERLTTDTARRVADFLYDRDDDILYLAAMAPDEEVYRNFIETMQSAVIDTGEWILAEGGEKWVRADEQTPTAGGGISTNTENNDMGGFHYRQPETYTTHLIPIYDEITFIDLSGQEIIKVVASGSTKENYPLSPVLKDVSVKSNTYVRAETYFEHLVALKPGEIYVSDVIGAYVGSNYIGMYTPKVVAEAAKSRGYDIEYDPEAQAYAGRENPYGQRFEGIIRWATPVTNTSGDIIGYVTFALNHDHIMEFVDHITPMTERYTEMPSAFEGNYAFIWDYQCRNICHPRHHSIVGYNPITGEPEIPWLETSIYQGWVASGLAKWTDYVKGVPVFDSQSRSKKPAPELTQAGLVGLDGRYLNNAPQCTGWMDLTKDGGSGSFYILWSGLYKLTTAGAIPYYTGQYAPSAANAYSLRGFGIVTIGAGLDDFTRPAVESGIRIEEAVKESSKSTYGQLIGITALLVVLVIIIAVWIASWLTNSIQTLVNGISRFRRGERQFRFKAKNKDEFGILADAFDAMAQSVETSAQGALSIIDLNGNIVYMNKAAMGLCEIASLEGVVGTSYWANSIYARGSEYDPVAALETDREVETLYLQSKGLYLRGSARHLYGQDGKEQGYIVMTTDITEVVRQQLQAEEQRILLDKIFSSSPDLIWYLNEDGKYLTVNPRFASVLGSRPEDFVGRTTSELFPAILAERFTRSDTAAINAMVPMYSEESITFADGHTEALDIVRTPLTDNFGKLIGILGFARDVTARVKAEAELRNTQIDLEQAVNDANAANQHKGEFLARMSHEIRTPMNAIIGITNIVLRKIGPVQEGSNEAEVKNYVEQIEVSSKHLLGLLNDILDLSKIEAGRIEMVEETVDLAKLMKTVEDIIQPRCAEKHIEFVTEIDIFKPRTFLSDSLRLRQVLINLLGNAVKFTPEDGTITFTAKKLEQGDGKTHVRFAVKDTGIGISDEMRASIFQAFEQGGSNISRQYGGTGLGLAISRNIVQLMGGNIEVESELGKGSTFYFSIWLQEVEGTKQEALAQTNTSNVFREKRMLLVDDVEINRMIVSAMLEETGIEVDEAANGKEAAEIFAKSPAYYYDIILMDVQMPVMDGYESSRAIRAMKRADANAVPIITLTANAFQEDIEKALESGMNAHISKPVEMDHLLEVLFRYLPPRG